MGTSGGGNNSDSEWPSWPEEQGTDCGALPSDWPPHKTKAVVAEAASQSWLEATDELEPLWERWYERAVEEGVDEDLAYLGRSLIREARLQRWDEETRAECGWLDEGEMMLELALFEPELAQLQWRRRLEEA